MLHDAMKLTYYLEKKEKEQYKKISSIGQMADISRIFFYRFMVNQIQSLVLSSGVPILY